MSHSSTKKHASFAVTAAMAGALAAFPFNAVAGEAAPVVSPERQESIFKCMEKLDAHIEAHDTRTPGYNMEGYYYYNDANMIAVKTAVQTGQFSKDLERLDVLGQMVSLSAFNLVSHQAYHCALLADENGELGHTQPGRDVLEFYKDMTLQLVKSSNAMMDIIKMFKTEGDRMIADGAKPADRNAPVYLFN